MLPLEKGTRSGIGISFIHMVKLNFTLSNCVLSEAFDIWGQRVHLNIGQFWDKLKEIFPFLKIIWHEKWNGSAIATTFIGMPTWNTIITNWVCPVALDIWSYRSVQKLSNFCPKNSEYWPFFKMPPPRKRSQIWNWHFIHTHGETKLYTVQLCFIGSF